MAVPVQEPLLEREGELVAVEQQLGDVVAGDGRLLLIEGPPGIGKTRLVAAARQAAVDAGMRCLAARGAEMERQFPFGVIRQLFDPVVAVAPREERGELFAGAAGLAERLLAGAALPAPQPEATTPFALYHGLYWLTANLAVAGPIALVVDDLHWADTPSLAALEYLGRRLEGLPVLLVVASRPNEQGFDRSVLDSLAGEAAVRIVVPHALSEAASAELLRRRLTPSVTARFASACHRATGGNPLLLTELASALSDEGVAGTDSEVARVAEIGPEAVARAVRLRLGRLPEDAVALVRAASVLGDGALIEDAAAIAGLDPRRASAAMDALVGADLIRGQATVTFMHPVVRAAVEAGLGPLRQREMHARAARLLADLGRPVEQVAAHLLELPPVGDGATVAALRSAAARSAADGAGDVAAVYLLRALEESPAADDRAEILFELGIAEQLVNGPLAAEHLRESLALTIEPSARARTALTLGRALYFAGGMLDAKAVFEQALAETVDETLVRSLETGLVVLGLFEPPLVELARERLRGLDLDGPLPDVDSRILLSYGAYDAARSGGDRETAVHRALRALDDRTVVTAESQGAWAAIAAVLWSADRLDDADGIATALTRHGEETGSVFVASSGAAMHGNVLHRRGALADADAYLASAIETAAAHGFGTVTNWACAQHALVLVARGAADAALQVLARHGLDGPLPDTVHLYETQLARGRALVELGRTHEGLADLRTVGARWDAIGARNPELAPWRLYLSEALLTLGERDEARTLAEEQLALARAWGADRTLAAALRVYGMAVGGDEGLDLLREAIDAARRSPGLLETALALVELGAALRRSNRRAQARGLLEEGMTLAHRCGARGLEERALQELLATGARPRRAPASGRDALTASELRVAEMAAAGQTNREIAQRLFVTQKTVEAHLARTFRKLGVDSRAQLPAALDR